jgi:hypothetical protein
VVLVGLNEVKVGSFTLREAVLAVELELGSDDGVLTPAVHGEGGLGENEGAGIRNTGVQVGIGSSIYGRRVVVSGGSVHFIHSIAVIIPPLLAACRWTIGSAGFVEETGSVNVLVNGFRASECMDGVGKSIEGVGVVERLSAEQAVKKLVAIEGRAIVNVLIRLDDPDEFFDGVVKVELDLVGRRTDGLVTGELELFNEVLVGVLCHPSALVGIQEDVIDVEGGGDEGLVVCGGNTTAEITAVCVAERTNGPQALVDRADIEVDLDFVVLKGDQGQSETGVTAVPELEGNVEGGFGEGIAGGANLARSGALARTVNIVERGVSDKGEFGGVSDHAVVTADLVNGQSEVVPDVHPVTVLAINALTTDFNFNLRNELFTGKVKPAGVHCGMKIARRSVVLHILVNFRESNLKVSAVCKITVSADSASNTTTEIGLAVKGLFNGFHSKVGVTFV